MRRARFALPETTTTALVENTTIARLIDAAARRLRAAGSASPRLDAQLLLAHAAHLSRVDLLTHPERQVPSGVESAFQGMVARRAASEPIAYLLGEREFYGRFFRVDRRALIPRPETELLVELGKAAVARWRAAGITPSVVDVGTGSGIVAISLALESEIDVIATDVSLEALTLARENAFHHAASVRLLCMDLIASLRGPLQVILANLPYVPRDRDLPTEVRAYEPAIALRGGPRGTELIERLLREAQPVLVTGGELCVELDEAEQAAPIAALARQLYPAARVSVCQDAGGYDRVVRVLQADETPA